MESTVIYRDRQELQSADLNNMQEFMRSSVDHIVLDAIENGKAYSGFATTKTAATEVTLSSGRLYAGGLVYARNEDIVIDLFNVLPLVTRKRVAIVAYGQTVETDVQPRDFLIDAQTGTTEPQSVALEELRRAEVSTVVGIEGPEPSYPTTDENVTVIAYVLLDTSGVISIEQWGPNKLPNLRNLLRQTTALENWRGQISGQVDTLRTDLAALADRMELFAMKSDVVNLTGELEQLRSKVNEPGDFIFYGTDRLLDTATSQEDHPDYTAEIEEGIRFPASASDTGVLSLLNPNEPQVTETSGFVLPKYAHGLRMDLTGYSSEEQISQYTYETTELVRRRRIRWRWRYGPWWRYSRSYRWWWANRWNYAYLALRRANEAEWIRTRTDWEGWRFARRNSWWVDYWYSYYWAKVTSTNNVSGQQIAQTFLNSQDGWLSKIGLFFSRKGSTGDVEVVVCETEYGMPNLSAVVSRTTLPVGDIQSGVTSGSRGLPALVETPVAIEPTFLEAGKRYAVLLITSGDHYVAMTDSDNAVVQGTFFASTDGAFFSGNLVKDMKMRLYFAQFEKPRLSVDMTPLQLSGGVLNIDILTETAVPPACSLQWEVQVNGAWVPLGEEPDGPDLSSLPAVLPLRATFVGTTDLMPGFSISESEVKVNRGATAFTWVSDQKTLGSTAASIKVAIELSGFDEVAHDCEIRLLTGAAQGADLTAAVVEDITLADGTLQRTATFSGLAADFYTIKVLGSTNGAANTFTVDEVSSFAQSA